MAEREIREFADIINRQFVLWIDDAKTVYAMEESRGDYK